jgi:CubicO group peptidase (beta-lactamase class C family)
VLSRLNPLLLGWVIEHGVGRPLDDWLMREIYRPLGLHQDLFFVRLDDARQRQRLRGRTFAAGCDDRTGYRGRRLQGEVSDETAWALGGVCGHAGLFGTVDAVFKLVLALWQSYSGFDRFFLGGTVRRFWTRSKRLRDMTRALAWDTPTVREPLCGARFSQGSIGAVDSAGSAIWIDLSSNILGVVLVNGNHPQLQGKEATLRKFQAHLFELIAKAGEALPPARVL